MYKANAIYFVKSGEEIVLQRNQNPVPFSNSKLTSSFPNSSAISATQFNYSLVTPRHTCQSSSLYKSFPMLSTYHPPYPYHHLFHRFGRVIFAFVADSFDVSFRGWQGSCLFANGARMQDLKTQQRPMRKEQRARPPNSRCWRRIRNP